MIVSVQMAQMLRNGIFYHSQNEYEQLNYAKQLKERLEAFTRDFLPHMKEEEEVSCTRKWFLAITFDCTQ